MRVETTGWVGVARLAVFFLCGFFIWGCPGSSGQGQGPVEVCTKVGEQCRIQGGQLGVCSMRAEGELFCMSQH